MTEASQTEIMRCWVSADLPGSDHLIFDQKPVPTAKSGTMVVRVHAAALNFSDLLMIDGKYQVKPPRPFTPGQEIAGVVVNVSADSHWKVGDRIASKVFWGGFAEYATVREDMAMKLPPSLDFASGAALPVVYMTAMVALHDCVAVGQQDTVLIHAAAGGVGLAAVEIAHAAGARVIATASSRQKRDLARQHGADVTIDYGDDDWKNQVKAATGGSGVSIVVDPVGGDIAVQSLRCLARHGTLLIVGFASGTIAKLPSNYLLLNSATVKGVLWDHDRDAPLVARMTKKLWSLWEQRKIDPIVDTRFSLDELPTALHELASRGSSGKLVLTV